MRLSDKENNCRKSMNTMLHILQAARDCWVYIQANLIDHTHGDWYKGHHPDRRVDDGV